MIQKKETPTMMRYVPFLYYELLLLVRLDTYIVVCIRMSLVHVLMYCLKTFISIKNVMSSVFCIIVYGKTFNMTVMTAKTSWVVFFFTEIWPTH